MLAYVRGRTLVKGVRNKNVSYVGSVESDGYIYFNDKVMYRCPTPSVMNVQTQVPLSDVQVWYTVRNCWIRANYFTDLTAYCFDPVDMYSRIQSLENWRTNTVNPFITAITNWKDNTVDPFITNITNWKNNTVDPFITDITNWKTNTIDPIVAYLGDFWEELKWYDEDHTVHPVFTLRSWMAYHNESDRSQKSRLTILSDGLNSLRDSLNDLKDDLGDIHSLFLGTRYNNFSDWLVFRFSLYNQDITALQNRCQTLESNYTSLSSTVSNHSTQIAQLWDALKDSNGNVIDINQMYEDSLQFYQDIVRMALSLYGNPNTKGVIDRLNDLGHEALGTGGGSIRGNGEVLLDTINKLNTVIGAVNTYHSTSIPYMSERIWNNWSDFS